MPLDVFLTTGATHSFRVFLAGATISAWCREVVAGRARLVVYDIGADPRLWEWLGALGLRQMVERIERPREGSQRLRHEWAHEQATSDPYLVVDDDCAPFTEVHRVYETDPIETWDEYARRVFAAQPDLLMGAAFPQPGGTDPMQLPAKYQPPDPDVFEVASLGGVRVVRLGAMGTRPPALPELDPRHAGGFDTTLCQWLKRSPAKGGRGGRVGYLYRWKANHLGFFASTVWTGGAMGLWPDPAPRAEATE